jgi:hypothetical protein
VGDRVDITQTELVVERISLMYTVFRRVDSDKIVQIPHNVANTLWIENVSRSKAMKERLTLNVAATTSFEDIESLRSELQKFVAAAEHKRDFQPGFEIELISVGDMKQLELRVEIHHKVCTKRKREKLSRVNDETNQFVLQSNFANESLRANRRNKFMCELLASMRRVPIEPPGGSALPLGNPANPYYSVSVPDEVAIAAREKHDEEVDEKRLFPKKTGVLDTITSALQSPVRDVAASVTGRRISTNSSAEYVMRRSTESRRLSHDRVPDARFYSRQP